MSGLAVGRYRGARRSLRARAFARRGLLRQLDWLLIVLTCALAGLGAMLVWAATESSLRAAGLNPQGYLEKSVLWAAGGIVLMLIVASIDYRRFRRWTPAIYAVAVLLLLAVLLVGQSVNGAKAWIALPGGFQVEPSEFAKLAVVLSTAGLLSRRRAPGLAAGAERPGMKDVGLAVLAAAPPIILVEREPALGVMVVLAFTLAAMIVVSGIRLYWVGAMAAVAAAGLYLGGAMHLLKGYQISRLTAFLHPHQNLAGAGYNLLEAKTAIGSGGMFGQGLFHGTFTRGNFVPSQETDFIFAVAGEELGFVGCALIVVLLGLIIFRAIRIAGIADDQFGMLVAAGVAVWFAFQTFVNVGMTIGIMPITGLPLPFVSYGGSATFADMIAVGLLQSVRRHHSVFD